MARITYLLGAGASFDALPIVNQFTAQIEVLRTKLYFMKYKMEQWNNLNPAHNYFKKAIDDLDELLQGCTKHKSVDTYAKMLFLTSHIDERKERYRITKSTIVLFFELFRYFKKSFDKRYDSFLLQY